MIEAEVWLAALASARGLVGRAAKVSHGSAESRRDRGINGRVRLGRRTCCLRRTGNATDLTGRNNGSKHLLPMRTRKDMVFLGATSTSTERYLSRRRNRAGQGQERPRAEEKAEFHQGGLKKVTPPHLPEEPFGATEDSPPLRVPCGVLPGAAELAVGRVEVGGHHPGGPGEGAPLGAARHVRGQVRRLSRRGREFLGHEPQRGGGRRRRMTNKGRGGGGC